MWVASSGLLRWSVVWEQEGMRSTVQRQTGEPGRSRTTAMAAILETRGRRGYQVTVSQHLANMVHLAFNKRDPLQRPLDAHHSRAQTMAVISNILKVVSQPCLQSEPVRYR